MANALGYPPELKSRTLLLETPHSCTTEHREIKLLLAWNASPVLAFTVLCILPEEKRNHEPYPFVDPESYINNGPVQQWHGQYGSSKPYSDWI